MSDGICGRLLAPMVMRLLKDEPSEGEACSRAIMGWRARDSLWLRRSSVVAFVTLARRPDEQARGGQWRRCARLRS